MKRLTTTSAIIIIVAAFILPTMFSGCYTDTIDSFSTFTVQLPLHFTSQWRDKAAPDSSLDSTNLNNYSEYRDNKDKIQRTIFYQFAYWIDSLRVEPGDPPIDQVEFDTIRYYLFFKHDPLRIKYLLGEFRNVKVKDYFRIPHVIQVSDAVSKVLETAAKAENRQEFYTTAEYSRAVGQPVGTKRKFPYIDSRFDLVIRLELKL